MEPEFSDILWHPTKIDGPKVFLLTKIKPEFSDILSNPIHLLVPWCVALDRFHCIYIIVVFNIYIGIYVPVRKGQKVQFHFYI